MEFFDSDVYTLSEKNKYLIMPIRMYTGNYGFCYLVMMQRYYTNYL